MVVTAVNVYDGKRMLGVAELYSNHLNGVVWERDIWICRYSPPSERCPPLAVLNTISPSTPSSTTRGICFKLELKDKSRPQNSPLSLLHSTCLRENKTAIMSIGEQELHLVAMHSGKYKEQFPCFWGFLVASGLYNSCLVMLNLRCLGIVFDLDETLMVANTMCSFEDRIEALQRKMNSVMDPQCASEILAETKRYQDDKNILKQYAENDQVIDDGKIIKSESEVVPTLSDNHHTVVRPLIRLQDKNIILTRINPQIRETSVLVRLRPAWEDLRGYLTARGHKSFEVFICTMAERDYALEMWRLLDRESNLINPKELLDRIVCVKSGLKKSLFNVFHDANCPPKLTLVIDDRLKVWDENDQPRVHVVPAFAPYHGPQAEANYAIPVLCSVRNIACNVRGGFFKEFDEGVLQGIAGVAYEDDITNIPSPPDVSKYLISQDDPSTSNGNKDSLGFDDMAVAEVERRLKVTTILDTDNFFRLPKDVIVFEILDRISEAKWLCSCSLVSRYFSSLVFESHHIHCKLPLTSIYLDTYLDPPDVSHNLSPIYELLYSCFGCFPLSRQANFSAQLLGNFLPKFRSLKSLHLNLDYSARVAQPELPSEPNFVKWISCSKSAIFLLVKFLGISLGHEDVLNITNEELADLKRLHQYFIYCQCDASGRYFLIKDLLPLWSRKLERIVVTDSRSIGKLILNQIELRNFTGSLPTEVNEWSISRIQLPLSGRALRLATIFVSRCKDDGRADYWIAKDTLEGEEREEPLFSEAVFHILQKLTFYFDAESLSSVSVVSS